MKLPVVPSRMDCLLQTSQPDRRFDVPAILIGLLSMIVLYLIAYLLGFKASLSQRRTAGMLSAAVGIFIYWELQSNPTLIGQTVEIIIIAILAVILGVLLYIWSRKVHQDVQQ